MDVAIVVDEIMITNRAEATLLVPTSNDVHSDILSRACCRAMDNDLFNFSHVNQELGVLQVWVAVALFL